MNTTRHRFLSLLALLAALGLLTACGEKDHGHDHDHEHGHDHAGKHGGAIVEAADHKAHFEIVHHADEKRLTLYVLDGNMKYRGIGDAPVLNLSDDAGSEKITGVMGAKEGELAACEWHFTSDKLAGEPKGRFRVKIGSKTYTPEVSYDAHHDDHDHEHDHHTGPHDGMVSAFTGPNGAAGYVELKLHDDKGDLELWIAQDEKITKPMDLPIGSEITVTFTSPKATTVTLKARNQEKNEDEDGTANNRDGKTNYFIFPGDSGADAAWLTGTSFEGSVTVSFQDGATAYTTKAFELVPHTHEGGDHDHD